MPRVKPYDLAAVKISLGDVYLAEGEIWEAVLLYGQVNQDFKEDAIGHEAKLRTATAYYYTGDFGWAKSQLDVLKSSSSKLIANDAMKLSILISDVLSIDTAVAPLQMYARADLLAYQGRDSMAQIVLDSVLANYPKHYSILDEVYFKKAELYKKHQDWTKAKLFYNKTVEQDDLLKDDALFKLAWIAEFIDQDLEKAQALYERIILEHDDSVFMIQARKRFRALRGS